MRESVATRIRSSCCFVLSFRVLGRVKELMEVLRSCAIGEDLVVVTTIVGIRVSWRNWEWE